MPVRHQDDGDNGDCNDEQASQWKSARCRGFCGADPRRASILPTAVRPILRPNICSVEHSHDLARPQSHAEPVLPRVLAVDPAEHLGLLRRHELRGDAP